MNQITSSRWLALDDPLTINAYGLPDAQISEVETSL